MSPKIITQVLTIFACITYCMTAPATDKPPHPPSDAPASTQKSLDMRKKLIHRHLPLTPAEAQRFWPLYDEYQIELTRVYLQRRAAITKLGHHFENMTDEMARQFVMDFMNLQEERLRILHVYLQKLETTLPGKKLLRFFQIENRFRSAVDAEIAEKIPLLK